MFVCRGEKQGQWTQEWKMFKILSVQREKDKDNGLEMKMDPFLVHCCHFVLGKDFSQLLDGFEITLAKGTSLFKCFVAEALV